MKPSDWLPQGWTIDGATMVRRLTADRSVQSAISLLRQRLSSLDAQTLLAHISGKNRAWILAHPEAELTPVQAQALGDALTRLENGEPLPYILGHWEFYGLDFQITPATLIPRPETELLVEEALRGIANRKSPTAADIGTGSGCIAVTLAVHRPELRITAADRSIEALKIARNNARRHTVSDRVHFVQADLLTFGQPAAFDLICANLPYIPTATLHQLDVYGREPTLALDGGPDGLDLIRRLLPQAARSLAPEGLLLLEIEHTQGEAALTLARRHYPHAEITLLSDLAGHDRLLKVRI